MDGKHFNLITFAVIFAVLSGAGMIGFPFTLDATAAESEPGITSMDGIQKGAIHYYVQNQMNTGSNSR